VLTPREWNAKRIIFCSLIGYEGGVGRVATEHPDVDFYIGQIDSQLSESGFIIPG
jgi:uracil phosphoribosyltransferase